MNVDLASRAVGGEGAGWYGNARPMLLIESGPSAVTEGRIHFIGRGFAGPPNFNCCTYEAITIGDVTQNDGWRLRGAVNPGVRNDQHFGVSVALGDNGRVLAVGAPGDSGAATGIGGDPSNQNAFPRGAVWLY